MHSPGSSSASSAFPKSKWVGFPLLLGTRFFPRDIFEDAAIPLCSGLRVCLPPRSLPPLQLLLQGSRGFYVRAECASLPSHTSDMLSARLQAIGGTRTLTSLDSQPCRPLLALHVRVSVPSLSPRQCGSPLQPVCDVPCCLRPTEAGSATGPSPLEATDVFTFVTAR